MTAPLALPLAWGFSRLAPHEDEGGPDQAEARQDAGDEDEDVEEPVVLLQHLRPRLSLGRSGGEEGKGDKRRQAQEPPEGSRQHPQEGLVQASRMVD